MLLKLIAVVFAMLLFCEFLIYYLVTSNWPKVKNPACEGERETLEPVLKAIFLADSHLPGEVRGHWLDGLQRMANGESFLDGPVVVCQSCLHSGGRLW